jgi:UDP-N-acetylglucosamine 1-carboxyvinyltransferase
MKEYQQKIGRLITTLRKDRGFTQKQLAEMLGTSQSAINRIENGGQNLSMEMLARISDVLNQEIVSLHQPGTVNFKIEGGRKLKGEITVKTSKNAAVALLCASLLNRGTTTFKKMPRIEEVYRIIEVLESIGVNITWNEHNDLKLVPPKKLKLDKINAEAGRKTRSIIMLMGPLMHLFREFRIPFAGGCKLGERTVRPHLYALSELGLTVETKTGWYNCKSQPKQAEKIVMYENGDTATENVIMSAALTPTTTVIKMASCNYMVQDLCFFLKDLGVSIKGIGTSILTITGLKNIDQDITYSPAEDPIEAMTFLSIAAVTNSPIKINRCPIEFLELEILKLQKMGCEYKISPVYNSANGKTKLVDITCKEHGELIALEDKIEAHPYPGINIDNLPYFVPVAACARGRTLIHDWIFENRAIYYTELNKLNARITLADVHRAYVDGPTRWLPAEVVCPPALRPAVLILIGMLAADGTSILRNVYSISRGYESLAERLSELGAKITILRDI